MNTPQAIHIAHYFLQLAQNEEKSITHLKLQKLVYFAHAYHLAFTNGSPLIQERIEAWKFGPVVDSLYEEFKHFKSDSIKMEELSKEVETSYSDLIPLLQKIWSVFGSMSALALSDLSHEPGGPWSVTLGHQTDTPPQHASISDEEITRFYRAKLGLV
jgi:uncharacterized phage-associated protein